MQKDKPKVQFGLIGLDFAPLFCFYFIATQTLAYIQHQGMLNLFLLLAAIPFAIKTYWE